MSQKFIPRGVPETAIVVTYSAGTGNGRYYVWPNKRRGTILSYYWHALGIEGEEPTFERASEAGRRRIRDGEYERLS